MRTKITATKSRVQDEEGTLWDNKVVITLYRRFSGKLQSDIDDIIDDIIDLADDNGGKLVKRNPLTFIFYECGQRWSSVEVDNFIMHLEDMEGE